MRLFLLLLDAVLIVYLVAMGVIVAQHGAGPVATLTALVVVGICESAAVAMFVGIWRDPFL